MLTMKSEFCLWELLPLTSMHWVTGEKVLFRGKEERGKNLLLHGNISRKAINFVSLLLFCKYSVFNRPKENLCEETCVRIMFIKRVYNMLVIVDYCINKP